jgi:hypothetical protein
MTADAPTCPYCNAQLPFDVHGRVSCPRCGETFNVNQPAADTVQPAPSLDIATAPAPWSKPAASQPSPTLYRKPIRANRLVAGVVLGVMALMAATGLTYALMTVKVRREHDTSLPPRQRKPFQRFRKETTPEPAEAVAPDRLAGLGYLPPRTALVAGLHVPELLASPAGRKWSEEGFKIGRFDLKLASVEEWLGVALDNIDHVVAGMDLGDGEELVLKPPTVVIRTRRSYDLDKVKAALAAKRAREGPAASGGKRSVFDVKVQGVALQLWPADETTLVLSSRLADVPAQPGEGGENLDDEVRSVLHQRVAAGAPLWLAGHSPNWDKTLLPLLLGARKDVPVVNRLKDVKTFALWLQPDRPARLFGAFRCLNEESAKQIETEDLRERAKSNPEGFKFSRDKDWLTMQITLKDDRRAPKEGKP